MVYSYQNESKVHTLQLVNRPLKSLLIFRFLFHCFFLEIVVWKKPDYLSFIIFHILVQLIASLWGYVTSFSSPYVLCMVFLVSEVFWQERFVDAVVYFCLDLRRYMKSMVSFVLLKLFSGPLKLDCTGMEK